MTLVELTFLKSKDQEFHLSVSVVIDNKIYHMCEEWDRKIRSDNHLLMDYFSCSPLNTAFYS